MRRLLPLVVLLLPALAAAQDLPIRWGDVTDAERALDAAPDDPDAAAVVLGDVGVAELEYDRYRNDFRYTVRRHRRVKVLRESGYELGEFAYRYHRDNKVRSVKGQTFVPEPDGSMRRVELEGGAVLDGDVGEDLREVRFSMPALTPGAIFEFSYVYESDNIFSPPPWVFQSGEPTLVSEYRFEVPEFFDYMAYTQGGQVEVQPTQGDYRRDWRTTTLRWTAHDVPALREEPFTTTEADYEQKVLLQLRRINPRNQPTRTVLGTWEKVANELDGHNEFGRRLRPGRRVRALAADASGTPGEVARALYDLVRTQYVWNERGGVFAERNLEDVVEAKGGTAAELNLLLASLLREAGVAATPVLLSTRGNGRALDVYPLVNQFDWVVVLAEVEGEPPQLLDATDPNRPYGLLPVQALSGAGWLADRDRPEWIDFGAPGGTSTSITVQAEVAPEGGAAGSVRLRLDGYAALDARTRLDEEAAGAPAAAATQAAEAAAEAPDEVEMEVVSVEGAGDPYAPLQMDATFAAPDAGEVVLDEIYLTPALLMRLDENPFERPTRAFPVDFAYPSTRTYVADLALPEGYAVEEVPDLLALTIPSRAVTYRRAVVAQPGRLVVRAVLTVAQAQVSPEEYPALRRLYDEIVAAEGEAVVLTRTAAPPPAAPDEAVTEEAAAGEAPTGGAATGGAEAASETGGQR
ncbi:DUF3857 domain-containing protein [Rubrivirga sp. S365]|uniref:DUF3857 domain-containing protein n=1 Tax=Rubrivirga sp. S365 TaxID=3076080 RepID=UPI0028CAEC5D|nr:DUF3857 domain-containing protein [Rubrivirga sp. S365]MDT7856115.1 DUF3857 domain-containing protein [Rubrivirga sp. S365]